MDKQEIYKYLTNDINKAINSLLQGSAIYKLLFFIIVPYTFIIMILVGIIGEIVTFMIVNYEYPLGWYKYLQNSTIIFWFCMIYFFGIYKATSFYAERKIEKIALKWWFGKIKKLNENIIFSIENKPNIQEIIESTKNIQRILGNIFFFKRVLGYIDKYYIFGEPERKFFENEVKIVIMVLLELREDLSQNIIKEQQHLGEVTLEVNKNLSGTPELLQASEAHKLRLDRQIEQFEELQKRLMRM